MDVCNGFHAFQLDQQSSFNQKVGNVLPNNHTIILHCNWMLLRHQKASLAQLKG